MALTFEPYDPDHNPRVFVGMFRPPFESITSSDWAREGVISYAHRGRDHWLAGLFDRPLYEDGTGTRATTIRC